MQSNDTTELIDIHLLLDDHHISNPHLRPRKRKSSIKYMVKYAIPFLKQTAYRTKLVKAIPRKLQFRVGVLTNALQLPTFSIYPESIGDSKTELNVFYPYYILNLAYLLNSTSLAKGLFQRAYHLLCQYLDNNDIEIYNAGPNLFNSLLTYYCYHHSNSKFYLISHAVYQFCHRPYYYQTRFESTISWVWSSLQAQIHHAQGVTHAKVLPNLKIFEVADYAKIDWSREIDVVIIGESSDKYYAGYNKCFQQVVKQAMKVLAAQRRINIKQIFFKPHPRTPAKIEWKSICFHENWIYTEQMPASKNMVVAGAFSTYLIEIMAEGIVGFQIQSDSLRQLIDYDDYTKYTTLIPLHLSDQNNSEAEVEQIKDEYYNQSMVPSIDPAYLSIEADWESVYRANVLGN